MLFQSYTMTLPTIVYYFFVAIFAVAIISSIFLANEVITALGIFIFSLIVRLLYFVRTNFTVFPTGDPYGQYTVLRLFFETSRVSILHTTNFLNFLTEIPSQYSEWPGLQAFAVSLGRVTNIPLFFIALIVVPFILYSVWFIVSYAIAKLVLAKIFRINHSRIIVAVCLMIGSTQPRFEIPPVFKYDFLADVFLLGAILLIFSLLSFKDIAKSSILIGILSGAIVVTHSLTALFWVLLAVFFGIMLLFGPKVAPSMRSFIVLLRIRLKPSKPITNFAWPRLLILVSGLTIVWWAYYAKFAVTYARFDAKDILFSFSTSSLAVTRVSGARGQFLTSLTSRWLLDVMELRDYAFLALILIGALVLIFRPAIFGKLRYSVLLLSVVLITIPFEVLKTINFNDRPFLSFSPLLALVAVVPLVAILYYKPSLAKIGALVIALIFLFTVALGFYGSSYAPVYLYSNTASAYSFGEHPTDWPSVASYINFGGPSSFDCVVSNEIYVTSLTLPVNDLVHAFPYTDIPVRSGCIGIIYENLSSFNTSYISEPYYPYPSFSNSGFANQTLQSDVVFSMTNLTIYYFQ
jgi:hypothetical protein